MIKPFKFSLRLKITLLFLLLVIGMMVTVGYIFTVRELNLRKEQMKVSMERLANNMATIRSVETGDWDLYQTYIDNQIIVNPDIVYIAIFDDQGRLKVHALNREWLDLPTSRPLTRMEQSRIVMQLDQRQVAAESQRDFERQSVQIMVGSRNLGTVNIGFSLVELNDEMRRNIYRNLFLDAIFLLLAVLLAFFIGSRIVNPLGRLTAAMEKITQGDLEQELHIASRDEIGEMASTFNYMTRGLQEKQIIENYTRELGFTIELDKIAQLITRHISAAMNAEQALLFLNTNEEKGTFTLLGAWPEAPRTRMTVQLEEQQLHALQQGRFPYPLKRLPEHRPLFAPLLAEDKEIEGAVIAPLVIKEAVRGFFLLCCPPHPSGYTEEKMQLMRTLLAQGGIAIENALLYAELTEQERLKRELEIAHQVQNSLLPQGKPRFPGLEVDGLCLPAAEIGGDYYDYFPLDDDTLGVTIADVTGKGTSAAFYMAVIKGMMLSLTAVYRSPKELLRELNRRILGNMDKRIFVTMIYATFDLRHRVLTFARAGHNALIKRSARSGRVDPLIPRGISLGLAGDDHFEHNLTEQRVTFVKGDLFLFYTDGISEAMNRSRQEFGDERLLNLVADAEQLSAATINEEILRQIRAFSRTAQQHDDITLVTARIL